MKPQSERDCPFCVEEKGERKSPQPGMPEPWCLRKGRTVEVERRILIGDGENYQERLKAAGLSGRINTSFVERLNLSIRQCVSKLTRRTWWPAHFTPELLEHLEYPDGHFGGGFITISFDIMKVWKWN